MVTHPLFFVQEHCQWIGRYNSHAMGLTHIVLGIAEGWEIEVKSFVFGGDRSTNFEFSTLASLFGNTLLCVPELIDYLFSKSIC